MSWVCTNCTLSGFFLHTFADTHSLGESSVPAVLVKSQVYTSFIYSRQPAEMRQDDPDQIESFSSRAQLCEAVHPSHCWTIHAVPSWHCEQIHQSKLAGRKLSSVLLCCEFAAPLGCPEAGAAGTDGNVGVSVGWRCHNNKQLDAVYWVDLCAATWISGCLMGTKWIEG